MQYFFPMENYTATITKVEYTLNYVPGKGVGTLSHILQHFIILKIEKTSECVSNFPKSTK